MNKKILSLLTLFLASTQAYAGQNGGPAFLFDSAGNEINSTSNALNVFFTNTGLPVSQGTSPWVTKDLADGAVSGGTPGTFSLLGAGIYNATPLVLTDGQQASLQLDAAGGLMTRVLSSSIDSILVQPGNTPNSTPWLFTINQGGNSAAVTGSNALKVDGSAVTQPVSGTVTANAGTGDFTVVQPTGANLHVDVDNFPGTQPVSGTVTAIPADGVKAAYSVVMTAITPAASATDVFTIVGSGTKTVLIREIAVFGMQTTGGTVPISLVKRSAADTGGTSTTGVAIPWSSANAAATAVVKAYTANPTLGTSVGTLSYETPFIPVVTDQLFDYSFARTASQVYTLLSAAESIAVNLGGATVAGGSLSLKISWTEE